VEWGGGGSGGGARGGGVVKKWEGRAERVSGETAEEAKKSDEKVRRLPGGYGGKKRK